MTASRRYRVIQWATGNVGTRALRTLIEHPALVLVGLWVNSDAKRGRDAGVIAGIDPCGVIATGWRRVLARRSALGLRPTGHAVASV